MAPSRAFKRFDPGPPSPKEAFDPLNEFLPESPSEPPLLKGPPRTFQELMSLHRPVERPGDDETAPRRDRLFTAAAVGVGLLVGVLVSTVPYVARGAWPVSLGGAPAPTVIKESTVTLTSVPEGAAVYIDGARAGQTPLSLSLPVGLHVAELRSGTTSRRASLSVEAGKIVSQHVDFGGAGATGGLQVTSDPPGAQVSIDGTLSGLTPLKVPAIAPGEHRVTISTGRTTVNRTVEVTAGATATVVASVPVVVPNGSVTLDAPMDLEILEGDRHLGSGRSLRISLPAGRHTLEVVNRAFGFRTETTVNVPAGRSIALNVAFPNGSLSINALPWAEVWVDGRAVGQTPIGDLSVSLGAHEVIWRHPEHGERRQTVLVSATEPVRLGVDWTR
jgi:hypothetical protein